MELATFTSNKKIRVAVCMYGQWRTGDKCKEYIKNFYNIDDVDVDFFCSVKNYDLYTTTKEDLGTDVLNDTELEYTIKYAYSPKKFNLIRFQDDINVGAVPQVTGLVDSINLKRLYELEQGIKYDITVIQRYDAFMSPANYFHMFTDYIKKYNASEKLVLTAQASAESVKDRLFIEDFDCLKSPHGIDSVHYTMISHVDYYMIGLNAAIDSLCNSLIKYLYCVRPSLNSISLRQIDFHASITWAIHDSLIGTYSMPKVFFTPSGQKIKLFDTQDNVSNGSSYCPEIIIVRPTIDVSNMNIYSRHSHSIIKDHYLSSQKNIDSSL